MLIKLKFGYPASVAIFTYGIDCLFTATPFLSGCRNSPLKKPSFYFFILLERCV